MTIKYRSAAVEDIRRTTEYLGEHLKNPKAATRLKAKLLKGISHLKAHPYLGMRLDQRTTEMKTEVRFLVVENQLVFYEVNEMVIEIIRILDGRTDYLAVLLSEQE